MSLSLVSDEEHSTSHFIYIYIYRLNKLEDYSIYVKHHFIKIKNCCPYCNTVVNNAMTFEEHVFRTPYDTKNSCNLE